MNFAQLHSVRRTLKALVVIAPAITTIGSNAALTLTSTIGGAPTGVFYSNFDALPLGSVGGASGAISVSFANGARAVQGTVAGSWAAPYISNSNGLLFGDSTVAGPDVTPYLTTSNGSVTLTLPGPELYFGLLWGSVDPANTLTFYNALGNSVGAITGQDVTANANGDQGAQGTFYVNVASTLAFTRVVASGPVFEFDNVSYNPTVPVVPEPSNALLLGMGLFVLAFGSRRRWVS